MSLFITFEGGEGSGKTTQTRALIDKLSRLSIPCILTHEPGGTLWGKRARRWLKWTDSFSPEKELLIFALSRAFLVSEVIRPALKAGQMVICDRYIDSTIAYQGYGRGIDLSSIDVINNLATQGLKPTLSVLLDISTEEGFTRKAGKNRDRFESEDIAFHRRVREGYLRIVSDDPERWLVVDASLPRVEVRQLIWDRISQLLA